LDSVTQWHPKLNFVVVDAANLEPHKWSKFQDNNMVLVLKTDNLHGLADQRRFFTELASNNISIPVVVHRSYDEITEEQFLLFASTDIGGLLIDGLGDGVMLRWRTKNTELKADVKRINRASFGILQAARTRITKTEYISCPSCGRTLFDLQETTAMIRSKTDHLKGVKIGIMGCIVNGPGEMADADYGYVGSGKGKITLYKGMNVVKKAVPSALAVDELIEIIKEDGAWIEPEQFG
jgi:(E)-4-hydroxy-3-methylbut-2-enyl-diphosphate synthase